MSKFQLNPLVVAFSETTIQHAKQDWAKERIAFVATQRPDVSIVVLTGVTGAGKSTALLQFAKEFLADSEEEMKADPSMRPLTYTVAVASGRRDVDWNRLYRDGCIDSQDPFAGMRARRNDGRTAARVLKGETPPAAALREQLESTFIATGKRIWIIDEAQHLLRDGQGAGSPGSQYDVLKSLAQTAGVRLLLCGTFDLPTCMGYSGQLSRRSDVIVLDRYRWVKEELKVFASTCKSILSKLPDRRPFPDIKANLKEIYVGAIGCVGLFKEWATRAFLLSIQTGAREITMEHFRKTRLKSQQLARINAEVQRGEDMFGDGDEEMSEDLMRAILRGAVPKRPRPKAGSEGNAAEPPPDANDVGSTNGDEATRAASSTPVTTPGRAVRNRRPGTRKPTRDPVGAQL